jgi:uncharacterized Zn finger protein
MSSVADLVDPDHLRRLATRSNLRLGEEIVRQGGVELIEFGPSKVVARVGGGQRRKAELDSTPQGLAWRCSCTSRRELFCKHCVALAIVTWEEAPARSDLS